MKKAIKLFTSIVCATTLTIGIAGCGETNTAQPTPSAGQSNNQQASTPDDEPSTSSDESFVVGIVQTSEHAALDDAKNGFIDAIADSSYAGKVEFDEQNAQGDQSNLKTIAQRFVQNDVDLVLAIGTPAAQTIAAETTDIPILITAVTDPLESKLVLDYNNPGTNVSGTSDLTPVKEQLDLLVEILPEVKDIGIMYTSSEINSEIQAKMAEEYATTLGLSSKIVTVPTTNDITQAVQSIVGSVEAIYVPTDNGFASAMATVSQVATENNIPVICGEEGMTLSGGTATVGINYYNLGYQTGEMGVRIFDGSDVSTMPIEYAANTNIVVNDDNFLDIGLPIPMSVLEKIAAQRAAEAELTDAATSTDDTSKDTDANDEEETKEETKEETDEEADEEETEDAA